MECYKEKVVFFPPSPGLSYCPLLTFSVTQLEHDACFYKWYHDEFLKGKAKPEQPCDDLFQKYRSCLQDKFEKAGVAYVMDKSAKDLHEEFAARK